MASSVIRVVDKVQYDDQTFISFDGASLGPLQPSSVRVRTQLIGLSANNLAYCALGDVLGWWQAYPVPKGLPKPFDESAKYGVAPGWGYCTVLESNISSLSPNTLLHGFIPFSTAPFDLQLHQSNDAPTQWIETSPHRSSLMPLYQRYIQTPSQSFELSSWESALAVWECGYLMNRFVFPSHGEEPISPFPGLVPWSIDQSTLKSTVLINIGASSKTSLSFIQQLLTSRSANQPTALLDLTSSGVSPLASVPSSFPRKSISYSDVTSQETSQWLSSQKASKFILLNFVGREDVVTELHKFLQHLNPAASSESSPEITVLAVGGAPKVYSESDKAARVAHAKEIGAVRLNTSSIREAAMARIGEEKYFGEKSRAFEEVVKTELERSVGDSRVLGIKMNVGTSLRGENSLEDIWQKLCCGQIKGTEAWVFRFD